MNLAGIAANIGSYMGNDSYELIIGLEVHVQSKTKSKMFCSCDANYFSTDPNTHVCPVCFGLPGALPVPNKKAIDLCIKTALALNCEISKDTKFDRKNYFYPDLPKGFQISQYDQPIGLNGYMDIDTKDGKKRIGITRVHQEEDTGKSIHSNGSTLLDFNKSGVPLIEIVSEPDFRTKQEVTNYCKRLRQIVRYLGVSNADMERGEMRFELNMSLRRTGEQDLPKYKVEVKNIASISVLEKVIDSEILRQTQILENGELPIQETRGLVDMSGKTNSQRSKENEADYRYFPEPDIPLIEISDKQIAEIEMTIPELPQAKKDRYIKEYSIDPKTAEVLVSDVETYQEFEELVKNLDKNDVNEIAKWYTGDVFALQKVSEPHKNFKLNDLVKIVKMLQERKISRQIAKELLSDLYNEGYDIDKRITELGLLNFSTPILLEPMIEDVMQKNPKAVDDARQNPKAVMFLVGMAMRELKGRGDAQEIRQIIESKLKA